jgi:hypothetical protein
MRIFFRPEARAETLEARKWYECQSPGLGLDFPGWLVLVANNSLKRTAATGFGASMRHAAAAA